jgi:hypothetical protein
VQRESLYAIAEVEQAEMAGADHPGTRSHEQRAAAADHVEARVVQEGTRHSPRAADADVVAGIGSAAATAVRRQKVVEAVVEDHGGGLAVDREIAGCVAGVFARARPGIELDEADVAEVGAVDQPQPAVARIEEHTRIDRVAVLDAVRRSDHPALFPFVVGGLRVERPGPDHVDRRLGLRADVGGDIHVVPIANVNDVRRQTATRERRAAPPRPAVVRDQRAAAGPVGVEPLVALDDRRRVVNADLAVEALRQRGRRKEEPQEGDLHEHGENVSQCR